MSYGKFVRSRNRLEVAIAHSRSHEFFRANPKHKDPETRQQVRRQVKPWRIPRIKFARMNNATPTLAQVREVSRRVPFTLGAAMNARGRL